MELEEFNKIIERKTKEVKEIYEESLQLEAQGVLDIKEYRKIGAISNTWWSNKGILEKVYVESEDIQNVDIDRTIDYLQEFKQEWELLQEIGKSNIDDDIEVGSDYLNYYKFKYEYFKLNEDKRDSYIKECIREEIRDVLKPTSYKNNPIMPDCKIVELFKNGAIDWKTLQQITYKNCEV